MHDDQHGTAIISSAALLNALEIAEKEISEIKIVVSGAGSAAMACIKLYSLLGVKKENVTMFDVDGVLHKNRTDLSSMQMEFSNAQENLTLEEALVGADVFLGLSVGNIITPKMLLQMNSNPIVFAMANPVPEIDYDLAVKTRKDIIMATGRSDNPNQVNNVLGFPFIFRGALDVRASKINEEMKMAAVKALANLAKEPVPEQVNIAYGETKLNFGKDYIIPKPFDPRLLTQVPPAVARAAMESGVAKEPIYDWQRYEDDLYERLGGDNKITRLLLNRAKMNPKRVVYAEADHLDVLKAAQISRDERVCQPILLGRREVILELMQEIEFENTDDVIIIDPKSDEQKEQVNAYAEKYWKRAQRQGITLYEAQKLLRERNYFAAMMVNEGDADALLSGYSRSYPTVVKPILDLIGMAKGVSRIAATNLMNTSRGPIFISDTSININPNAEDLARIAKMTSYIVKMFGMEPVMAMISYANYGSSKHPEARKVKDAVQILHEKSPDLLVDGELQVDFALNKEMLQSKFPFSKLAGRKVNSLIFPNLDSANSNYKLIKELNKTDSIGPIMMGLNKPAHVLQLGASVEEMVNMTAVAVVDAQEKEKKRQAALSI